MTRDTAIQPKPAKESRDLDPNVRQRRASSPDTSVWVNASAGTGKTKVLTDRVLRLLLPQEDGQEGTKPHRILCLTFTKAAAAEMALRINERLSKWAVMSDEDLRADLEGKLLGKPPTPQMMVAARKLFVEVLDSPGGLNIMTIHAFCQSLLGRFPIEAGLSPNFEVIDDTQSQILLDQARDGVLKQASNPEHDLNVCLQAIAQDINDSQFSELLRALCRETGQLAQMSVRYQKTTDLKSAIYEALRAPIDKTRNDILADFCTHTPDGLSTLCAALSGSGKNDHAMGSAFQSWIESDTTARQGMFDVYANALIKKDQTPRSIGKKLIEANAELPVILNTEVQRILETRDQIHALHNAALTQSLLKLGQAILSEYAQKKSALGVLDYEDLINRTLALLSGETRYKIDPSWVLFKLDGGLDHILIDEAQDTNPEQWRIISILTQEFYAGSGQSEIARTLFVVGDEKQSIYSFQRAAPLEFERMRSYFAQKIQDSGNNWRKEDMTISFRSTKSVLQLVDRVFEDELARRGLGAEILPHDAFRRGAAGHAELWPLTRAEESEKDAPWTPPITIQDVNSAQNMLANQIATQIDSWLKNEEQLESQGRAIKAGDILVLVRTRTAFVNQLVRALKSKSIPVSGVDRLALNDALSVQDLIVAAEFALLPFDDLALATLLKSPFIGLSEEELYEIAIDRDGSLWQALQASEHADIIEYCTRLIGRASYAAPYDFFAQILQEPCPAHEISGLQGVLSRLGEDALDPIEEFMTTALDEERESGISLQRFVHGFRKNRKEIKRELEEAGNAVRIMTIHGAKGLQAPIVFLPDTTRTHAAKRTPRLLWPDKTELDVPLWCPRKDIECKSYRRAFDRVEQTLDDEYRRLLYVALTRAEDRIYICGTEGKTGYL
ncbi:MAG: double-strand break repair helicase AddA, partial [Pseudomonadota bacterium]